MEMHRAVQCCVLEFPVELPQSHVWFVFVYVTVECNASAGTSTFRITFEKTSVKTGDFSSTSPLPSLSTPEIPDFLRPPSPARSGQFETTYLDTDFRVSRGDLGELRIFVRA